MDHSMMSSMGGMDMGSGSTFRSHNQSLARIYWYLIAACAVLACSLKVLEIINSWSRKRTSRTLSVSHPTRPRGVASQTYATTIAVLRELSYPPVTYFSKPWPGWLSPPPLGRSLAIITYWAIITLFLTTGSIVHDAYYWERIGFRAAWVSVIQVPLIYLFAGKVNIVGIIFGSSYIDLNWIHRWVSRTLLITVTVHGGFFVREWVRADFFKEELAMMPMVKWGMAAWCVLVWTMFSSFLPLRRLCYELFVIQHLISAAVFLWLLYKHVPSYAAYNVWMAVAFAVSGRLLRACIFLFRNLSGIGIGQVAELQAMPGEITRLTIRDVKFTWRAGQHILLWCPALGPLESHPFTIASISQEARRGKSSQMDLVIRARSGFTRKLYRKAASTEHARPSAIRAFITGPFGNLPSWNTFETVVLISASTGASFTLPILEGLLNKPCCVSRIDCLFLVRERSDLDAYLSRVKAAASHPRAAEMELKVMIAVTGPRDETHQGGNDVIELGSLSSSSTSSEGVSKELLNTHEVKPEKATHVLSDDGSNPSEIHPNEKDPENTALSLSSSSTKTTARNNSLHYSHGRPDLSDIIRDPIEASAGETSIVVCGGKSLTSTVRSCAASLADERAVHKGTGAQGIHLHVEGFGS